MPAHLGVMVGQKSSRPSTPPPKVHQILNSIYLVVLRTKLPSVTSIISEGPDSGRSQASIRPKSHIERRGGAIPNSLPIQNLINGHLFKPNPTPAFCGSPGKLLRTLKYPSQTPSCTTTTSRPTANFHPGKPRYNSYHVEPQLMGRRPCGPGREPGPAGPADELGQPAPGPVARLPPWRGDLLTRSCRLPTRPSLCTRRLWRPSVPARILWRPARLLLTVWRSGTRLRAVWPRRLRQRLRAGPVQPSIRYVCWTICTLSQCNRLTCILGQYQGQGFQGQQAPQQQQQAPRQTPTIAKRPNDPAAAPSEPAPKPTVSKEGGAKVLSIGGDAPKPKAKVLSIGGTAPPKEEPKTEDAAPETKEPAADEGSKVTAAKAIEKTGEKAGSEKASSGKTSPTPSSGRSSPSRAGPKGPSRDAVAVEQEQTADVDEETLKDMYGKEHVNIIFIGHVDAGKSTLGGSILVSTGMVDQRTLDKYKKEAKDMVRVLRPPAITAILTVPRVTRRGTCRGSWILQMKKDPRVRLSKLDEGSSRRRSESTVFWMRLATRHMCQT